MVSATTTISSPKMKSAKALNVTEQYQISEKLINEGFKVWKKASPMLYDLIYTYSCDWPSLTVQWLEDLTASAQNNLITAKFLLGTHTTDAHQNYLKLYGVDLPLTLVSDENFGSHPISQIDPVEAETSQRRLHLLRKWRHPGEINKVRFDEELGLIATQTNSGDILIYDYNDIASDTSVRTLKYHLKEGFGLEWSPTSQGRLLSGNEDSKIALWDLSSLRGQQSKTVMKPSRTLATHTGIINDISWNCASSDIFASISDDGSLQIHDLRAADSDVAIRVDKAHEGKAINAVEFHPTLSSFLSTGAVDGSISCWDLRDASAPVKSFMDILGLISGQDSREHDRKDENADASLIFVHGGHTGRLCEADWHPKLDNVVISCAEDSLVEIWRPLHIEDEFDYEEQEAEERKGEEEEEQKISNMRRCFKNELNKHVNEENVTVKAESVTEKSDDTAINKPSDTAAIIGSSNDVQPDTANTIDHKHPSRDVNMD
ncbi:hypothetical protein HII12_004525 [Brettanomyces bruxellensis]|uniref:Histone-binding protein RBBP4-like N-terminal domain-containing protein n=1 Tax=Dekkera bruxellensis TaxID=5007 RepID=A0A8H6B9F5_DEKBR|nr:hypothetical protein HII12_004525 [Brettanomyces bruxellensis]